MGSELRDCEMSGSPLASNGYGIAGVPNSFAVGTKFHVCLSSTEVRCRASFIDPIARTTVRVAAVLCIAGASGCSHAPDPYEPGFASMQHGASVTRAVELLGPPASRSY